MQLEDYFDFTQYEKYGEIRVQGHRIYMHHLLSAYLKGGCDTPQLLLDRFPSLDMEKVLACLLYYHTHREAMDKMVADMEEWGRQMREKQRLEHPEWYERLARLKAERERAAAV